MRRVLILFTILFISTNLFSKVDPCSKLRVYVDDMKSEMPFSISQGSIYKDIRIEGDNLVFYISMEEEAGFYYWADHTKKFKKEIIKIWSTDNNLESLAEMLVGCNKSVRFEYMLEGSYWSSFEVEITEDELQRQVLHQK